VSAPAPVAGVLLAAGQGARFGKPKALAEFRGAPLADRGARMLRDGGAAPVVVVTGAVAVSLAPDLAGVILAHNPRWRTGMGSSLAAGLRAIPAAAGAAAGAAPGPAASAAPGPAASTAPGPAIGPAAGPEAGAAVVALVDQPLVGPQAVRRLIAAHRDGAGVVVAAYRGVPRNPVLLAREHWAEVIERAVGDVGARPFLRAHPELVTLVECGDIGDPADADTPADLAALALPSPRVSAAGSQAPRNGPGSDQDPG
jgi:CTP:molybdopterin cytidylyltransferase MocA